MQWTSKHDVMSGIILVGIVQMLYELSMSFVLPQCAETRDCIISSLHIKPQLYLSIFTSPGSYPIRLDLGHSEKAFSYSETHRLWYFWGINSLVNGVFMFDFLFMLPGVFDTYELKLVLPMPTAHRILCFSNDAIFLINLYQTCIYLAEKSDKDNVVAATDDAPTSQEMHDKKETDVKYS